MNRAEGKRALQYIKALKRRRAEYEEECESYYRQGFRPHYCIHGMNLWVDYDPICGACESGWSDYELAIQYAKNDYFKAKKRAEWLGTMPNSVGVMPRELYSSLLDWAMAPMVEPVSEY